MNAKTIALYLSLGLTSSLLIGVGVNAKPLNSIPSMMLDNDATVIKWATQDTAEEEISEAEAPLLMNQFDVLDELKALQAQGQRLLKGEFPNVHDFDDDDDYEDDCYEDDDEDDDYEDDDLDDDEDELEEDSDDDDDDDEDEYCEYEENEDKGSRLGSFWIFSQFINPLETVTH